MAFSRGFLIEATFAKIIEADILRWQSMATHIVRVSRGPLSAAHSPAMWAPFRATERFIRSTTGTSPSGTTVNIKKTSK
jgi:hypothetical protein